MMYKAIIFLPLFGALIARLAAQGQLVSANKQLRLPEHQPVMAAKDRQLWARVEPALSAGGLQPPAVHDLAQDLGVAPDPLFGFLRRAAAQGSEEARQGLARLGAE